MKLLLYGGTTEGRELAKALSEAGCDVTVSVATELGAEELRGISCTVQTGRLTAAEMERQMTGFSLVVDATHPYAVEASENIRTAALQVQVPYRRVLRAASKDTISADGADTTTPGAERVLLNDCAEAAAYLESREGNVLLATGTKELHAFAALSPERLFPRVLPTHEALDACETLRIPHRNILALQGPFSAELNEAMFRQYHIRYLVTKDGGDAGGFAEKQTAAGKAGVTMLLIRRPDDEGISVEALLREVKTLCASH